MPDSLTCNCGNRFFIPTVQFSKDDPDPIQVEHGPVPVWCPGCQSLWCWMEHADGPPHWQRVISGTNLAALRLLSHPKQESPAA